MFVLNPDGKNGNGANQSTQRTTNLKFFGKLGLYFIGVRVAYLYFGAPGSGSKSK